MKNPHLFTWFYSQSIRNKVLGFGVLMSTIPLLFISYFYYTQVKIDLEERISEKQELLTKNLSNEIKLDFSQTFQQIQMFSALSQFGGQKRGFYKILQQNESIEEMVITDNRGLVVERVSRYQLNFPKKDENWFTDDMWSDFQTRDRAYGNVEFNDFGQPIIKLAIPFLNNGERYGIGVSMQLQKIIGKISSLRQESTSYLYLLDRDGRIIAHQDYSKLWEETVKKKTHDVLSTKTNINELEWTLVMEQPKGTAYVPINKMFQNGITAVALSTLIISLISIYAGLYFTKPILVLDRAMKKLKLEKKIEPIEFKQMDEVGKLAQTFNRMAEELHAKSLQLEMEKERLNLVVEGIGAGLALVTKDYSITWMNPTLKSWMDHKDFHLPCYSVIGGYESPCVDCPITDADLRDENYSKIMKHKSKKGMERIFHHRVYPLNHAIEGEGEFLVVIEDITEQKEMEEKIIQTDKLSALGLMASSFAHEVNNPLTTISVSAEDLYDRLQTEDQDLEEEEMEDYLQKIIENTKRCKRITSNLLNFSRKSNWNYSFIDMEETLYNSIQLIEHTLKKNRIVIERTVDFPLSRLEGDSLKLMQVFVNIINNAVDAMEDGGKLMIHVFEKNNHMNISFQDTGTGIPPENLSNIFDPFYTTKPVGKGTGLGLSVCYGIVKQFEGNLEIESKLGEGTKVTIYIPLKEEK
ncbi:ATP-binding protein [Robertmurraya massiliosenegalensis]|uniref:ATP-binding protein n=1 Tax=Robertmurraya massiliosenegalensis TaxID=1287657 RepID=UPI0002D82A26|nr:ATP-binding protein [Robertmurraya massiliosenegalensis]